MRPALRSIPVALSGFVLLTLMPAAASACSACMGNPNTKTAGAINDAIFLMLGFVALMLGSIAAFIYNLWKRAKAPTPPHVEVSQMMTAEKAAN